MVCTVVRQGGGGSRGGGGVTDSKMDWATCCTYANHTNIYYNQLIYQTIELAGGGESRKGRGKGLVGLPAPLPTHPTSLYYVQ